MIISNSKRLNAYPFYMKSNDELPLKIGSPYSKKDLAAILTEPNIAKVREGIY